MKICELNLIGHGENSITYLFFCELNRKKLVNILSKYSFWTQKFPHVKENDIEEIHLFPCFGKRVGYGEPDAIILLKNKVVYVEIELKKLDKQIPSNFIRQMRKFIALATDLENSSMKRLRKAFIGESGYRFEGQLKLRSLFKHIKKAHRDAYFLIISDAKSKEIDVNLLKKHIDSNKKDYNLGWITFDKIKKMKGMKVTTKCINYNLQK